MSKMNTFLNALAQNIQTSVQRTTESDTDVYAVLIDITINDGLVLSGFAVQEGQIPHWFEMKYTEEPTELTVLNVATNTGMNFELLTGDTMPQELIEAITETIENKGQKSIDLRRTAGQNLMEKVLSKNEELLNTFNTPVTLQIQSF